MYIIGVNDGTIPHEKSYDIEDDEKRDEQIEEERRLCYVGITRAKEELFMTMTGKRTLYGRTNHSVASRFIEELPDDCIERLK